MVQIGELVIWEVVESKNISTKHIMKELNQLETNKLVEIVYTVDQVSKLLHVNKNYIYQLINKKILPVLKFKSYRIRKQSLEIFLQEYENVDLSNI